MATISISGTMSEEMQALTNHFVTQAKALAMKTMIASAQEAFDAAGVAMPTVGTGAKRGRKPNGSNLGQGKGQKRDPEFLKELQDRFHEYVTKNPGQHMEQIVKALGTTTKELQLPVRKALADGLVKTKGDKRATTYTAKA